MGIETKIEWCDHTFNPWRGCTKVSAGCSNCYAERLAKRNPSTLGVWGDDGSRAIGTDAYFAQIPRWNAAARHAGKKATVFCLSLGDFWEERPELRRPRTRTMEMMLAAESLVFLVLTKRPLNALRFFNGEFKTFIDVSWSAGLVQALANKLWLGTSIEDQDAARHRLFPLLSIPCRGHFASIEPMLGPIDLGGRSDWNVPLKEFPNVNPIGDPVTAPFITESYRTLKWVICGGESGTKARPMNPSWVWQLLWQCRRANVPFFFKQWGEWVPAEIAGDDGSGLVHTFPDFQRVVRAGRLFAPTVCFGGAEVREFPMWR